MGMIFFAQLSRRGKFVNILETINPIYLDDLRNKNHYSVYVKEPNYKILIVRGFDIADDELSFTSRGLFFDDQKRIFSFDFNEEKFVETNLPYENVDQLLKPIFLKNEKIIEQYTEQIDQLEDDIFDRDIPRIFMDLWFDLKKDLSRIERYYGRMTGVIQAFLKDNLDTPEFPKILVKDLLDEIAYAQHHLETQISRLDALYNYYNSLKSEKLNNNLYALTVISAIFLPLNLIVGFFGRNTENLFFKDNPAGTQYVAAILIGTFFVLVFGIPLGRLLDKYLLRFLLGKSHIYKRLSTKLTKIEELLKIED